VICSTIQCTFWFVMLVQITIQSEIFFQRLLIFNVLIIEFARQDNVKYYLFSFSSVLICNYFNVLIAEYGAPKQMASVKLISLQCRAAVHSFNFIVKRKIEGSHWYSLFGICNVDCCMVSIYDPLSFTNVLCSVVLVFCFMSLLRSVDMLTCFT